MSVGRRLEDKDTSLTVSQRNPPDVRCTEHKVVDGDQMGQFAEGDDTRRRAMCRENSECSHQIRQGAADDGTGYIRNEGIDAHQQENGDLPRVGKVERIRWVR